MPTPQEQEELDKKAQEGSDKTEQNEDEDLIEDEDDEESDDDDEELEDLEDEILEMTEEDLQKPENQKKALEALNNAKSAIKQKKVWRDRAIKAGYSKETPAKKETPAPKTPAPQQQSQNQSDAFERFEFRMDHPEVSSRQVDQIEKFAKANGISLKKAYKQPLIQRFIKDSKKKQDLLNSSPSSQHRGTPATPPKDWSKATRADVEQRRREIAQGRLKSR